MSQFITSIENSARTTPDARVFFNSAGQSLTYAQLLSAMNALGAHYQALATKDNTGEHTAKPIAVYGHKSPGMIAAFFAASKAGCTYVPLDTSAPSERIASILEQLDHPILVDTTCSLPEELRKLASHVIELDYERDLLPLVEKSSGTDVETGAGTAKELDPQSCVQGEDTFYIIFTSGSTGTPKGVEVSTANIDAFWRWMCSEFTYGTPQVFFNRAPFSFDLSVTDLIRGIGAGDTLFALEEEAEASMKGTMDALAASGTTFWVSTPSFAEMCLADPAFNAELLPKLHTFFFVGETLRNETALQLLDRFPGAKVVNGYGPTESTVLVTATSITREMCASPEPLPVGSCKPNTQLAILDPESLEVLPAGAPGELFIIGDTVAKGYFNRPDATEAAFASYPYAVPDGMRSYRTGDECVLDETGMLHFRGRLDFQVKLHGYRIELGDIEANLCLAPEVRQACVIPVEKQGVVSFLRAFVQLEDGVEASFNTTKLLKERLATKLPEYMVPRAFSYLESFPLNVNGKIDRKALLAMAEGA